MLLLRWLLKATGQASAQIIMPPWALGTVLGILLDKRSHSLFLAYFMMPKSLEMLMLVMQKRRIINQTFIKNYLLPLT